MRIAWIVPLLAVIAIALLLVCGPGVHMGWWSAYAGLQLMRAAAYVGILTAVLGIFALLIPATRRGFFVWLVLSVIAGIAVAWVPWHWLNQPH